MAVVLRPARLADLATITEIYAESVLNGIGTYEIDPPDSDEMSARFSAITRDGFPYIVAQDENGMVLGYAYASPFRTRAAYQWLCENSVYVASQARGRNIGRLLLDELIGLATSSGFRQMVAVIGGANPASVALHRAAGFELVGVMKASGFKQGQWLDTVLMQLALGEAATTLPKTPPRH